MSNSESKSSWSWRRLLLSDTVPYTARATFFYELISAPLAGIYAGVAAMMLWVAKETFEASDFQIAILVAAPAAANLFTVYWAHLSEGRPKMPWVFWPVFIARLLILCVGFAFNSWMLVALGVIANLVISAANPALNGIWRNNYPSTHRYRALAAVFTTVMAVSFATSYAIGWLFKTCGDALFREVFIVGGILGLFAIWIFSQIKVRGEGELKDLPPESKPFSFASNLGVLWRDRRFGKFMLLQTILGFSNLMCGPALVRLIKDQNADWVQASMVLSAAPTLVMVLTMPWWGRMLQGMSPWRARGIQSFIWMAGFALVAFSGANIWLVVAGQAVVGAANGGGALLWSLQQMHFARKEDVPKYMGVHCTLTGIRGLTAPFVGVWLMGLIGAHGVFAVAVGGFLMAELLALTAVRAEQREADARAAADADE